MALIDVSELLTDPDFVDPITAVRRTQTVGNDGIAVFTNATLPVTLASVQPGGKDALYRFPDLANPDEWIRVYCDVRLVAHSEAEGIYGDMLTWKGGRYQVQTSDDWSNFGAGYTKALARLIPVGAP